MCVWPPRGAIPTLSPLSGWERQGGQLPGFYKLQFPAQRRDLGGAPSAPSARGGGGALQEQSSPGKSPPQTRPAWEAGS